MHFNDSVTAWVHYSGYDVAQIMVDASMRAGVFEAEYSEKAVHLFDEMYRERIVNNASSAEKGYLLLLLYELGRHVNVMTECDSRILRCVAYINTNYKCKMDNDILAGMCNMSKSRFIGMFSRQMGISPIAYVTRVRINVARELLVSSDISITDIASACGYDDPLYFSRVFKKIAGCCPRDFKRLT